MVYVFSPPRSLLSAWIFGAWMVWFPFFLFSCFLKKKNCILRIKYSFPLKKAPLVKMLKYQKIKCVFCYPQCTSFPPIFYFSPYLIIYCICSCELCPMHTYPLIVECFMYLFLTNSKYTYCVMKNYRWLSFFQMCFKVLHQRQFHNP